MLKRISTFSSSKGLLLSRRFSFTARRQTSFSPSSTSSSSSTPPLGLGLRHTNPPDSHSHFSPDPPNPLPNSEEEHELSDQEWELRTGRNIDILQSTLPEFFVTGLMSSWDSQTGEAFPHRSMPHIPTLPQALNFTLDSKGKGKEPEHEPIYSPKIRLSYSPPAPLPHPLPQTLQLEGKLYFASAVFVRHSLNTLYSDLKVTLTKVAVSVPKSNNPSPHSSAISEPEPIPSPNVVPTSSSHHHRQKSVFIALRLTGTSRVTGAEGQWEVRSTYTFSPYTAQITHHMVNSINPAPHQTVYDALYQALAPFRAKGEPSLMPYRGKEGMR